MGSAKAGHGAQANAEVIRTGLLGREILASRSPWMHQQEAAAQALLLTYDLFDFTGRGWSDGDMGACLDDLQAAGFAGVNVTHPFKQAVIRHLDALAPSAQSVGAVNCVHFIDGRKIGHNTDVTGFAESVRRGLAGARLQRVVQFGAGGAGSATAQALLGLGVEQLTLVEADAPRATRLADHLRTLAPAAQIITASPADAQLGAADGVVNATPMGMAAHPGMSFAASLLHEGLWVADIVYFPLETELLRQARLRGCKTLNGKGMAVFQAADAFDIFTGMQADRDRMLTSFDAFIDRR